MELQAAIEGLSLLPEGATVEVVTDSKYLQLGMTEWMPVWKTREWKSSNGVKVKNLTQWEKLDQHRQRFKRIQFSHVHGHSGVEYNEMADEGCRRARLSRQGSTHLLDEEPAVSGL